MKNNTVKIEKGIPIPNRQWGPLKTYPFDKLKVGESFVAPKQVTGSIAWYSMKLAPKKFTTRTINKTQRRIWRIA